MFKPTPQLQGRLRFTTKQVGKGFYRGTRTGAMGAHTQYGGYLIDWRKTRNYAVPDLKDFKLTPFVSLDIADTGRTLDSPSSEPQIVTGPNAMDFLLRWKEENPDEYDYVVEEEAKMSETAMQSNDNETPTPTSGDGVEATSR